MAHIPTTLRLSTRIPVDQPTQRQYTFDFAPGTGSAVVVKVNDVVIAADRYTVEIAVGGQGGSITFLASMQTTEPVMLAMDDVIVIERDTEVRLDQVFGASGYASSAAVQLLAAYFQRVDEELTARTETHAEIHIGEGDVQPFALLGTPERARVFISLQDLVEADRIWVEQSLDYNRIEWDAGAETLTLGANDGRSEIIDLSSLGSQGDHAYTDAKARAQAVAAIAAGVEAWARSGGGDVPAARLPYATTTGDDGIVSTNDMRTLAAAQNAGQVTAAINRATAGLQSASDVAGLIDARVPAPASGDIGSFLEASGIGSTRWKNIPDASETEKGLVQLADTDDVAAATDDTKAMTPERTAEMIAARAASNVVPSGNTLPPKPWRIGQRFRLLQDQTLQHDPHITYSERDSSPISDEFRLPGQTNALGPRFIRSYNDAWGNSPQNPLRNRVFIDATTRPSAGATFVWYPANREFDAATDVYAVADAAIPGYTRWYRIGVNSRNQFPTFADTDDGAQTGGYHVNIRNWVAGAGPLYPNVTVNADDLTFEGGDAGQAGWIRTPGLGLDRAQVTALIRQLAPTEAITTLHDGVGQSLNVAASGTQADATYAFTSTFDLDDDDNQSGLLEIEATLTFATRSDATMGWGDPGIDTVRFTAFATAASLRALSVNNDAVAPVDGVSGIAVGNERIRASNNTNRVTVGRMQLWIVKTAGNELRYRWEWPGAGTSGYSFTYSTRLLASFIHQEAGAGAAPATVPIQASFTPTSTRAVLASAAGAGSTPQPQTVSLAAVGTLPDGITLSANVISIRDAGLVAVSGSAHIEAWLAPPGDNNSRNVPELYWEHAPSGSTNFTVLEDSRVDGYVRVAKNFSNHGDGEFHLRPATHFVAAAGDQIRLRFAAEYIQNAATQHAVLGGLVRVIKG